MKRKKIVFLFIICLLLVGCHNKYKKINQKEVNQFIEDTIKEDYEIISKTKTQSHPDHELYEFKSKVRDLKFNLEAYICFQDYGLPTTETCIDSGYKRAIGDYYKQRVINAINKYYDSSKYSYEYYSENIEHPIVYSVKIETKEDIDKFIKLINDVKEIYSEEMNYYSEPYDDIIEIETQYCEVRIGYNDSSDQILSTIYQSLADKQVEIDGVDLSNYHKKEIKDVYINNEKVNYDYTKIKYIDGKYYVDLFESYTSATDYSTLKEYLKTMNMNYDYVINDYSNYQVDKTIKFTINGSNYEISFYKDDNTDPFMKILKDGKDYSVKYSYFSYCQFLIDIDDFTNLFNLNYQENNGVMYFSSK